MWEFFATHFGTIVAVLGGLGAVGVVVAIVAFGVPAALTLAKVVDAFNALVRFFSTPLGQAVGVIILCALAFFAGDVRRTRLDAKVYAAKVEASKRAAAARDAELKSQTGADVDARMTELQQQTEEWRRKAGDYEAALSERGSCRVTDDDLKRLLRSF